jgi:hypothetical protein
LIESDSLLARQIIVDWGLLLLFPEGLEFVVEREFIKFFWCSAMDERKRKGEMNLTLVNLPLRG